ncbi:Protein yippee-like 1 [Araneus ventricosus]|uniref:Protein yippee-like 1 n=5 Tax=Arthropoda TaxID=6656 RepID=A0A4Y2FAH1_ARAVE|nr:Protein yippee-like 1 [Araneus ventricosus]
MITARFKFFLYRVSSVLHKHFLFILWTICNVADVCTFLTLEPDQSQVTVVCCDRRTILSVFCFPLNFLISKLEGITLRFRASNTSNPKTGDIYSIEMVKTFQAYLPNCHRTYSCIHCRAHLANHDELISKSFQGSQGRAYLFNSVVNVGCGPAEERVLLTGLHAVADIYCECCKTTLGWKYEHAFESSQKYKEGKFIIELAHMIKENGWD